MRILYFTRGYNTHDRRFVETLSKDGRQVIYLRLERDGRALEDRAMPPGVEIARWAGGKGSVRLRDYSRLLPSLKAVLRKYKPDLVHAGPLQSCAFLAALSGFRPLVGVSWGSDILVDAQRSPWHRWATRYVLRRSEVLVGDCNPVRRAALAFGMPDERIVTFPWGIDLEQFKPAPEFHPSEAAFTLLSTRSWEPIYGVDVIARGFVHAAQELSKRGGPALRMVMLGGGSQAGLLHSIFQTGGVEGQVHFPGQVSQADLPRLYACADLYVSGSHSDGTSISLLEAMASGKPVLVSDIPGNREWVEPGVQGWLFPDGDSHAFAWAVLQAVDGRVSLPEMGRAARCLAEEKADWRKNYQQLLRAYRIALGTEHG
jgi:glycosyltransferase involved in cell wall biosynthesis